MFSMERGKDGPSPSFLPPYLTALFTVSPERRRRKNRATGEAATAFHIIRLRLFPFELLSRRWWRRCPLCNQTTTSLTTTTKMYTRIDLMTSKRRSTKERTQHGAQEGDKRVARKEPTDPFLFIFYTHTHKRRWKRENKARRRFLFIIEWNDIAFSECVCARRMIRWWWHRHVRNSSSSSSSHWAMPNAAIGESLLGISCSSSRQHAHRQGTYSNHLCCF